MIMSVMQRIININGKYQRNKYKNRTYYFFDDMINIANFDPNLLKIDKSHTKTLTFITLDILL